LNEDCAVSRTPICTACEPLILPALLAGAFASIAVCVVVVRDSSAAVAVTATAQAGAAPESVDASSRLAREVGERPRDEPAIERPRATQRDRMRELLQLELDQPGSLDARAAVTMTSAAPTSEQATLLRALYDSGAPEAFAWFEQAVRSLPDVSTPDAESLPSFAVGFLYERAERDEGARRSLARIAADRQHVDGSLRARAIARVAQCATAAELRDLQGDLRCETDAKVLDAALAALESRCAEWDAWCIVRAHGRSAPDFAAGGGALPRKESQ
jgi:hypothetical protein